MVGLSESLNKLVVDAERLMKSQNSKIEIIITIKIYRFSQEIMIAICRIENSTTASDILRLSFDKISSRSAALGS